MEARLAEEEDNKIQSVGGQILMMKKKKIINGTVTLMKKKFLDSNEIIASVQDRFDELIGRKVSFQLISSSSSELINGDPHHPSGIYKGKIGKASFLEDWASKITPLTANDISFPITFDWNEEDMGLPGAFIIQNFHSNEFYLKTLTLKDIPGHDHPIHFICNSWIYPSKCYENDRVFFTNQTYLPSQTPSPLLYYREKELEVVRGKGSGILREWDRVYDYDIYNDLGDPDKGDKYNRPILGGSSSYPYPRRCRTGRPPAKKDPRYESRLSIFKSLDIYIPRDERLSHLKMCDVVAFGFKTIFQFVVPGFEALLDTTPTEFDKFEDILDVYQKGIKIPDKISSLVRMIKEEIPFQTFKELLRTDGERFCHFPVPQIIENDKSAWSTDEEFAREMLAGLNPVVITCLQEFPANSMLLKNKEQIVKDLEGLSIDEALKKKKLFKLDFHDAFMPYLNRINSSTSTKIYATRTLLFLKNDGTLKPLAIELSLPNPNIENEEISQVYMPAENGIEGTIWQLAKAYVAANDAGYHQLICHWLHTHAVMEPIIIATNRQLSVVHPIHKLLHPHFRDTMNLNALARQGLINGGGLLERTMFPSQFCMEISSLMYNDWTFPHQALPADLLKRGVAVEDENSKHGLRLLIEDYPYAVDGLEIWSAIKTWVKDYCSFYYKTDDMIQEDSELQSWWNEVREKGHPDKKDEPWWPKMEKQEDLIETCTIIIWVASALHAAVNFGQYPYGGYLPNRPAMTRRLLPEPGTDDYEEMGSKPEKAFLKTVTSQLLSIVGISLVEILSRHSVDEVFLGQRENMNDWTRDEEVLKAFEEFGKKLLEVEEKIMGMNKDGKWRNRVGPGNVAYTLLLPSSEVGLTGRGIPNSVSM